MRIWDQLPPERLCRPHLLAQWREGLGLWNILIQGKKGYASHPETKRWRGFERALWCLLSKTRSAMIARGWNPKALPDYPTWVTEQKPAFSWDEESWPKPWDNQLEALKSKKCGCRLVEVPA